MIVFRLQNFILAYMNMAQKQKLMKTTNKENLMLCVERGQNLATGVNSQGEEIAFYLTLYLY